MQDVHGVLAVLAGGVGIAADVEPVLARISERPAYAQLRERTREIERLKSEF